MAYCPNCGANLTENTAFCPNCGTQLNASLAQPQPQQTYGQQQSYNQPPQQPYGQQTAPQQPFYQQPVYRQPEQVPPYPTGGLMAWSIITLLLCTIAGIVAIVQTTGINKAATVEEQQKKIKSAKTWCIVGTVVGILAVIGSIAGNMS